ncbi:MAG: NADPH-dependent F420 reductase [Gammaproteobacteria bacterium]
MSTILRGLRLLMGLTVLSVPLATSAETFAIIGTGEVSSALGPQFASLGHEIIYGSRSPDREDVQALVAATGEGASATTPFEAAQAADVVVLGLPDDVAEDVVIGLGDLSGKIIIDPINPRRVDEEGWFDYPTHSSNAERLQLLQPGAMVVKAFNTFAAPTMTDPDMFDHTVTVPIAGNDAEAKAFVAGLCEALGFDWIDFGPVRYAHILEGLFLLRVNARRSGRNFEWSFPAGPED